jgi:alpha-L-rhamnosidase
MKRFQVHQLRTEYHINPLGIDAEQLRFYWQIEHPERDAKQQSYQIQVATQSNALKNNQPDCWDSGIVPSAETLHIPYEGSPLQSRTCYYWRVRVWDHKRKVSPWSRMATFETALHPSEWQAEWITPDATAREPVVGVCRDPVHRPPAALCPLLRHIFPLEKPVQRARVYMTGLGYYELHLNGKKVGDRVLDPPYTTYSKRIEYSVYDVTKMLKVGKNCMGAMLGQGWWLGPPVLLCQIQITFVDGTETIVTSNQNWEWAEGPIVENSLYGGETYDARLEINGWDTGKQVGKRWKHVKKVRMPEAKLQVQTMPPIKVIETLTPVSTAEPEPGVRVYDFGQNFTGWCEIKVRGKSGAKVIIRHAELAYPDGKINPENLRSAKATDIYLLKGKGIETYAPRFTYHGYRYAQIETEGEVEILEVQGKVVHTALEPRGHFACSNELLNQIHRNALWGYRTNWHSVPTDCPQRDERQGWMGDAHMTADMGLYNFHVGRAYRKFLQDIQEVQGKDGSVPDTVPFVWGTQPGDPMWSAAYPFITWDMFRHTGDIQLLSLHYHGLKRYVDSLAREAPNGLLTRSNYGDWVSVEPTPKELIATGSFYMVANVVAQAAQRLGKEQDRKKYRSLCRKIAQVFHQEFFDPEKSEYGNGSQFSNALPLYLGIVPPEHHARVLHALLQTIEEKHNGHLSTGFIGTRYLLDALVNEGHAEVAYQITSRNTYPGWGYTVLNGATTIWELWKMETGPGMNSHNHPAFGFVSGWFYSTLAGLKPDPDHPGWKHILVQPYVTGDLVWTEAQVDTLRGVVAVRWERQVAGLQMEVSIPANCSATVYIPDLGIQHPTIHESRLPIWQDGRFLPNAEGVHNGVAKQDWLLFEVGSGDYQFEIARL